VEPRQLLEREGLDVAEALGRVRALLHPDRRAARAREAQREEAGELPLRVPCEAIDLREHVVDGGDVTTARRADHELGRVGGLRLATLGVLHREVAMRAGRVGARRADQVAQRLVVLARTAELDCEVDRRVRDLRLVALEVLRIPARVLDARRDEGPAHAVRVGVRVDHHLEVPVAVAAQRRAGAAGRGVRARGIGEPSDVGEDRAVEQLGAHVAPRHPAHTLAQAVHRADLEHERGDDAERADRDDRGLEDLVVGDDLHLRAHAIEELDARVGREPRARALDPHVLPAVGDHVEGADRVGDRRQIEVAAVRGRHADTDDALTGARAHRDEAERPSAASASIASLTATRQPTRA
jgi:hypothetical protein